MTESPARHPSLSRDFELTSLRAVRHQVETWARDNGLTDLPLYRFVVAVNEITTNAIRHGGGRGHLALCRTGDRLHCTVVDTGGGIVRQHKPNLPQPHVVGGRGLWLAQQGTDEFTMHSTAHGTTVSLSVLAGAATEPTPAP